jgi:RNA polymerase sigma-70 factor (ECF subfamily)
MSAAPSIPESAATFEAAQAGLLYERYSSKILGYCRRRLRSREEAEDAVQHTFLNAYRSLRTGVVPHAEAAWLYKIAENVCREHRRSAWRRSRVEIVSDDGELRDAVATPVREHDELAGLADALAELTPNQRRAILLREWQGLTYREIAAELETTESAVETLLFRARGSLARKLDRSRGHVLSGLNLGSLVAWGKSLLGGAAVKVAAATVVVAAGVAFGTPSLREHVVGGGSQAPAFAPAPASLQTPAGPALLSDSRSGASLARSEHGSARTGGRRTATPTSGTAPAPQPSPSGTHPGSVPAPVPGSVPGSLPGPVLDDVPGTVPVTVPPPPPLPVQVDVPPLSPLPVEVEVPPLPPLPVEVPPVPPVTVPDLPSVPPIPELPKLP